MLGNKVIGNKVIVKWNKVIRNKITGNKMIGNKLVRNKVIGIELTWVERDEISWIAHSAGVVKNFFFVHTLRLSFTTPFLSLSFQSKKMLLDSLKL